MQWTVMDVIPTDPKRACRTCAHRIGADGDVDDWRCGVDGYSVENNRYGNREDFPKDRICGPDGKWWEPQPEGWQAVPLYRKPTVPVTRERSIAWPFAFAVVGVMAALAAVRWAPSLPPSDTEEMTCIKTKGSWQMDDPSRWFPRYVCRFGRE